MSVNWKLKQTLTTRLLCLCIIILISKPCAEILICERSGHRLCQTIPLKKKLPPHSTLRIFYPLTPQMPQLVAYLHNLRCGANLRHQESRKRTGRLNGWLGSLCNMHAIEKFNLPVNCTTKSWYTDSELRRCGFITRKKAFEGICHD